MLIAIVGKKSGTSASFGSPVWVLLFALGASSYNRFIPALVLAGIELNRKMLSELAVVDPAAFDAILELVKPHLHVPKTAAVAA